MTRRRAWTRRSRSCPIPGSTPRSSATGAHSITGKAARTTSTSCLERRSRQVVRNRRVLLLRETADVVRQLPPEPKRKVRAALAELQQDPDLGEPLERELSGMRRVRVGQLRIVYRVSTAGVEVVAIGPRRSIYAELEREARRADAMSATRTASHKMPRVRSTGVAR